MKDDLKQLAVVVGVNMVMTAANTLAAEAIRHLFKRERNKAGIKVRVLEEGK